jgi:hypothetical protein
MRGGAPGIAAMARRAGALTGSGIDAERGALTVRRLRLPPARPRTLTWIPQGSVSAATGRS